MRVSYLLMCVCAQLVLNPISRAVSLTILPPPPRLCYFPSTNPSTMPSTPHRRVPLFPLCNHGPVL